MNSPSRRLHGFYRRQDDSRTKPGRSLKWTRPARPALAIGREKTLAANVGSTSTAVVCSRVAKAAHLYAARRFRLEQPSSPKILTGVGTASVSIAISVGVPDHSRAPRRRARSGSSGGPSDQRFEDRLPGNLLDMAARS